MKKYNDSPIFNTQENTPSQALDNQNIDMQTQFMRKPSFSHSFSQQIHNIPN